VGDRGREETALHFVLLMLKKKRIATKKERAIIIANGKP